MTEEDIRSNWYYYCALVRQLQQTEQFVDHSVGENGVWVNGMVFSNEFAKILMLAASEFEVVSKSLCKEIESSFNSKANIVRISKTILEEFPRIGETAITTPYTRVKPLKEWKISIKTDDNGNNSEFVEGLDWWNDNNEVKHNRRNSFSMANLKNCIEALASLLVIEMYLSQRAIGNFDFIVATGCEYFSTDFEPCNLVTHKSNNLPDFNEKDKENDGIDGSLRKNNTVRAVSQESFNEKMLTELKNGDYLFVYDN